MANDTAYDVLKQFSPGLESYTLSFPTSNTSSVTISNTATTSQFNKQEEENQEYAPGSLYNKNTQAILDAASDYYVGTYIPTLALKQQNIEQTKEEMGFGKRYTANDFKYDIQKELGPFPKTSSTEKAMNLLFDMLTRKTNLPGKAGVLDVLIQSGQAYMNRDQMEKANQLKQNMLISEMAIKQANDMNAIMLNKEAELMLKGMGYTEEALQKMMNYNTDVQLKYLDKDIEESKMLYEHSLLMLRNPEKAFPYLQYSDDGGKNIKTIPVQLKPNPIDGSPMYMMKRRITTDQGSFDVFDQPIPEEWDVRGIYTGDAPGTESKAMATPFGAAQLSEIGSDYFVMTQAVDEMAEVLDENQKRIAAGQGPIIGTAGFLKSLGQEIQFIGKDVLNTLFGDSNTAGVLGTKLENLGETNYRNDLAKFELLERGDANVNPALVPDFEAEIAITYEVPGKGIVDTVSGGRLGGKTKTQMTSLRDMLDTSFYRRLGYDDVYARNKVRENYLVYAIARALKSSGRLNVNDIEAAREMLTITSPFTSSAAAESKIREIQSILNTAAQNIVNSTMLNGTNILDLNPALKSDYEKRYGPYTIQGQEPVVGAGGGSSADSSIETQGTIYTDPNSEELDINLITGSSL